MRGIGGSSATNWRVTTPITGTKGHQQEFRSLWTTAPNVGLLRVDKLVICYDELHVHEPEIWPLHWHVTLAGWRGPRVQNGPSERNPSLTGSTKGGFLILNNLYDHGGLRARP